MTGRTTDDREQETANANPHELVLEVIHELRTPLTSIRGALGLLLSGSFGTLSAQGERMLNIAINNTERLMRLTKAIEQDSTITSDTLVTAQAMARLRLETELRSALAREEFQVYYQPIQTLATGQITGFEALVRWWHPVLGIISPTDFIPLAEETGLIVPIGQWVLREACFQLKAWQQQFPKLPLTVSVNLSSKQLSCHNLVDQVRQILDETKLDPGSLKLEITESGMMDNPATTSVLLFQLQKLGIQLYIDDFGTGYSSLSRLHELPIDVLKIDRTFVNQMSSEVAKLQIIRSITSLAWNLGMEVIAEGIETPEQVRQLKALGCNLGQGYFFSEPVNSTIATSLISR